MTQITPKVLEVDRRYIRLSVPSVSEPLEPRTVQYYPSGKHFCDCPGWSWFRKRGEAYKLCRHAKMTTMQIVKSDQAAQLEYAVKLVDDKTAALPVTWGFVACQFPIYRGLDTVQCTACPLFPNNCNVHPIRFGKGCRNNRKPLIWKVQSAIYNGRRKEASRLLRRFARIVAALKAPCPRCGDRGYVGDGVECVCHPNKR